MTSVVTNRTFFTAHFACSYEFHVARGGQRLKIHTNKSILQPTCWSALVFLLSSCSYEFTWRVAANDLYEGLQTASDTFVLTTLNALGSLQTLHTILLIVTLGILAYLVLVLLVPFRRQLLTESNRLAGLLSQLPQVRW
jgi:hypothetical protein